MLCVLIQPFWVSRLIVPIFQTRKKQGSERIRNWPNNTQLIGATGGFKFPFPNSQYKGFSSGSWLPFLTLKNPRSIQGNETNRRTVHTVQKIGLHQTVRYKDYWAWKLLFHNSRQRNVISDNDISLLIINLAKKMFFMIILSAGTFVGKLCSEMLDEVHFWKVIGQYGSQAIEKFIPFWSLILENFPKNGIIIL